MTTRDVVRTKSVNRGWTYVANGLVDTYSKPVSGWPSRITPKGNPAWDQIANWKPQEQIRVVYDTKGDPVSADIITAKPDPLAKLAGRWISTLEPALGTKAQKAAKIDAWLDKQSP